MNVHRWYLNFPSFQIASKGTNSLLIKLHVGRVYGDRHGGNTFFATCLVSPLPTRFEVVDQTRFWHKEISPNGTFQFLLGVGRHHVLVLLLKSLLKYSMIHTLTSFRMHSFWSVHVRSTSIFTALRLIFKMSWNYFLSLCCGFSPPSS